MTDEQFTQLMTLVQQNHSDMVYVICFVVGLISALIFWVVYKDAI